MSASHFAKNIRRACEWNRLKIWTYPRLESP